LRPGCRRQPGEAAGGETGGEEIAAGGRLPVEHLAGGEDAGARPEHQFPVDGVCTYPARGGDRLVQRARRAEPERQLFGDAGEQDGIGGQVPHCVAHQRELDGRQPEAAAQVIRKARLAAGPREPSCNLVLGKIGQEVDPERGAVTHVAQRGGEGIEPASLDAGGGDHHLAPQPAVPGDERDRFQRRAEMRRHRRRPRDVETHVRRRERGKGDACIRERPRPGAIGAEPGPGGATEGEDGSRGFYPALAIRCREAGGRALPAEPAPAGADGGAGRGEPREPAAEQGRGLHASREDTAGRACETGLSQRFRPFPDLLRSEGRKGRAEPSGGIAVSSEEIVRCFRLGEVQPRLACHQELSRHAGFRLGNRHGKTRGSQHFGGDQPGGAGADHQCGDALDGTRQAGYGSRSCSHE